MPRAADPRAKIALLRAAEEVFAERGLAAAKVEDIAKHAGVSKGAFYLHFDSKEAALKQIVESFLARCGAHFAPPNDYVEISEDPDELLDFSLERDLKLFDFLWENRAIMRILPTCQGAYDYLVEAFRAEIDQKDRAWIAYFKSVGFFRAEVDADLAVVLIGGAYNELSIRMLRHAERPPLEEWTCFALETFVRAFGTPEAIAALGRRNRRVTIAPPRRVTRNQEIA